MKPQISFDDFSKLDLRVGEIIECERKERSDKLLRLTVYFGDEGTKNILSGIAEWYKPEQLAGKQFIFVINLEPRKLMGEMSEGMILAANGKKPLPLKASAKTEPGTTIR